MDSRRAGLNRQGGLPHGSDRELRSGGGIAIHLVKQWVGKPIPGRENILRDGPGGRKPGTVKELEGGRSSGGSRKGRKTRPKRQPGQARRPWAAPGDRLHAKNNRKSRRRRV